jgi:hypothetical protein
MMRVFYCTDHDGHYPVGVCSIIVAPNEEKAYQLLQIELITHGLKADEPFTLTEVDTDKESALILLDGNY